MPKEGEIRFLNHPARSSQFVSMTGGHKPKEWHVGASMIVTVPVQAASDAFKMISANYGDTVVNSPPLSASGRVFGV